MAILPVELNAREPKASCTQQLADAEQVLVVCAETATRLYEVSTELDGLLSSSLDAQVELQKQLAAEQNPPVYFRREVWALVGFILGVAVAK